jgi:hypothetical protein
MRGIAGRTVEKLKAVRQQPELSELREGVISGLVAAILLIGVVWNLPESAIKRTLMPVLEPVAQAAGLDQTWRMYAPNVIRQLENTEVQVTMADGSTRKWVDPSGDKVIGPFSWYHWQKLKENVPRDPTSRADLAHWVVRELTNPSEKPIRVQIIMRTKQLPLPGQDTPNAVGVQILYNENLTGRP